MRKGLWKGLSKIEIGFLGIISICLIYVMISGYSSYKCRSIHSEVYFGLSQIYAAQKLYFTEHDRYASANILFNRDKIVMLKQKYYIYKDLKSPDNKNFKIVAQGRVNTPVEQERWSIDQDNNIRQISGTCPQ